MCSSASLNFSSWISLSPEKWTLSSALDHTQPAWYHEKKKSHLVFTSFYSLTLVYFLSVSSCAKLRLPAKQAQDSAKPANAHFHDSWTLSQSATSEKPFPEKTENKRESFKHKSYASTNPRLCCAWCNIENRILASLKKSMRVLNMWLMIVQVYAIAPIAVNVGYPKFSFS